MAVDKIEEEIEDNYSNDDLYNINSWGADPSFRELITMYKENELIKPELQRKYVWDKLEASRFIESLLLGLPVPSIFLAKTEDNKKLIIDGYQRIMTVYDFIEGVWSKDNSVFTLSNSDKINERWRNKAFVNLLDSDQRKIKSTTIHAIIFEQKAPQDNDTSLYQIFERINTSGRTLNPQEIRNCVYHGKFNALLIKLNKNTQWRTLFAMPGKEDERMLDLEFILRYFALNNDEILSSSLKSISLKKTLNEYMGRKDNQRDNVLSEKEEDFNTVIDFIYNHLGDEAFFNLQANTETIRKRFYPTVYDSLMIGTSIALKRGFSTTETLINKRLELLKDAQYKEYITQGTMRIEHIKGRVKKVLNVLYDMDL